MPGCLPRAGRRAYQPQARPLPGAGQRASRAGRVAPGGLPRAGAVPISRRRDRCRVPGNVPPVFPTAARREKWGVSLGPDAGPIFPAAPKVVAGVRGVSLGPVPCRSAAGATAAGAGPRASRAGHGAAGLPPPQGVRCQGVSRAGRRADQPQV